MKRRLHVLGFALLFILTLFAGLKSASALDTAVVGQPYYYPYGAGGYGPYAPIAFPGLYRGVVNNPNPALNSGFASNPFFLSTMVGRASGQNVLPAQEAAAFIFYRPVPGQNPLR